MCNCQSAILPYGNATFQIGASLICDSLGPFVNFHRTKLFFRIRFYRFYGIALCAKYLYILLSSTKQSSICVPSHIFYPNGHVFTISIFVKFATFCTSGRGRKMSLTIPLFPTPTPADNTKDIVASYWALAAS